ncbi:2'-5' RNA ligase family protein [Clostridium cellulovorans]|uniref:2'-5' RNA ligase n=1 Tax=Clostridium cellulovorans (strain ATCC 35296 / DSM 3052 / OCM 3 / 743B) TaxID=573061 RepID=D9SPL2_CLOC7|nr:2'-5' RNA ligase family protein [Clostridium cellulovorans]ADL50061.1 hypothetical protein Clocel_0280 [Clostridium cellulovorans 743B]
MLKRCIMIFPKFENGQVIDKIREKYDPLVTHVRPHITLVFPFDSNIKTNELKNHISLVLSEVETFEVILKGITPVSSFGKYLFLNIEKGTEEIIQLHKKLYTGILEEHFPEWLKGNNFLPHMTVGSFQKEEEFQMAAEETKAVVDAFRTIVTAVSVEIIDENEDSIIELEIPLKAI